MAVSAGCAVRDTKADPARPGSVRPCVKVRLTWRAGRRPAPHEGGSTADGERRMIAEHRDAIRWRTQPDLPMIPSSRVGQVMGTAW